MFGKDIVGWTLDERDSDEVAEIHLLKDGTLWMGPWLPKKQWERNQMGMRKPYPRGLRMTMEQLMAKAVKQERLAI